MVTVISFVILILPINPLLCLFHNYPTIPIICHGRKNDRPEIKTGMAQRLHCCSHFGRDLYFALSLVYLNLQHAVNELD